MTRDIFQQNKATIAGAHLQALDVARTRLIPVVMVLMMGYLAIGLRLADLTLFRQKEVPAATAAIPGDIQPLVRPLRSALLDRNGGLMATSLKMASLYADATKVEAPEALAKKLAAILTDLDEQDILKKISSGKKFTWIQRNITPKQEYAINALGDPGLGFQEEDRRLYPNGSLTAHITGYTDVDGRGIAGAEKFFNKPLAEGTGPVTLTVDLRLQHVLRRELAEAVKKFRAKAAIGMIMDVHTGEIIALVSLPDFDPNRPGDATDLQKFNRATLGVFEMGSTFKLFSTAAALDSGQVSLSTTFDATDPIKTGRFTISDHHPKRRPLTVPEIFIYSSNIGTAKMAAALGPDGLKNFYKALGFFEPVPIELPEKGAPLYPSPWRDISTLTTAFGHGIAVTPLHLMRAAAALVNGGVLPTPTLVRRERGGRQNLYPEQSAPITEGTRVISAKTSDRLRQLLELTVAAGTGGNAYVEGYNVGGKTGTAEKNAQGRYERDLLLSSFLGIFPVQNPRYAILAMLDEPKAEGPHQSATGGWAAAPVVARVVEQMGPLYHIPPNLTRGRTDVQKEMAAYLKEFKEGSSLASLGTDR